MTMPRTLLDYGGLLPVVALVFARMAGLMIASPILGAPMIPRAIKFHLVLAMTFAVFPMTAVRVAPGLTWGGAAAGMLGEFAIGASLGLAVSLILNATQLAGMVVEQQAGLAASQVLDPVTGSRASVLGEIYFILGGLLFLAIGGERELVRTLLDSFARVPLMGYRPDTPVCDMLVDTLQASFVLSVRLAAPAVIALLLTAAALGFLARTMPQLNVLSVGFSIKILVAVVVLLGTFPLATAALENGFGTVFEAIRDVLGPAGA